MHRLGDTLTKQTMNWRQGFSHLWLNVADLTCPQELKGSFSKLDRGLCSLSVDLLTAKPGAEDGVSVRDGQASDDPVQ